LVRVGNGLVLVDATFDFPLKNLGFDINDWDGVTSTKRPVKPIYQPKIFSYAETCLASKKPPLSKENLNFYNELNNWLQAGRD
jgi:hypothetical protein